MTREGWPPPDVLAQAIARINRPDWDDWDAQVHATGGCACPVRLAGHIDTADPDTGTLQRVYDTTNAPDGVLLKACQSRRATRCPACAAVYRGDARNLVLAGLLGGKGTPDTVAGHPAVFVTLTAPSFGAVHRESSGLAACRPGPLGSCPHGRPRSCPLVHTADDPDVGAALCPACYDYGGAVIFNALAAELWHRTAIATHRALAGLLGLAIRRLSRCYRLAYVKVVEYQRRGVVHVHAVVRVDPAGNEEPPGVEVLIAAVRAGATRAAVADPLRPGQMVRWGDQVDVEAVTAERRPAVAYYLAKYATKSADDTGALDRRLTSGDLTALDIPDHLAAMAQTAWTLGDDAALAGLNLRHWAHTLGYRGHWLTKSPTWSTTFAALRAARHHYQLAAHGHDPDQQRQGNWSYQGMGYQHPGDAWLAHNTAANRQLERRTGWEEQT